jgi:hypothetical protein
VASRRLTHTELSRLDDSSYREYCRADRLQAANTTKEKGKFGSAVDLLITTMLLVAVLIVVLQHYR